MNSGGIVHGDAAAQKSVLFAVLFPHHQHYIFFPPRVVISCDDALHFRVASIGSRVTIKASLLSWASEAGAWAWGEGGGASPKPARVARPMQLEVE